MSLLSFLPFLIITSGTYLLIKTKFFFILHPKRTLKFAFSGKNSKKSVVSLMLALAGTLGVGNIVGVAVGISIGGAGSVFWLIASALFSSVIKYSEVYLSTLCHSSKGIIGLLERAFGAFGKLIGKTYAALALILAFFMGSVFQAEAIRDSAETVFFARARLLFIPIIVFTVIICILGKERIKGAVALIIPTAALVYTGMCLIIILSEIERLAEVISSVMKNAFNFGSISGGVLGFISASGIKEGFARGLLSNEAGAGTSSFSHTSHRESEKDTASPYDEASPDEARAAGIFGIIEVFFDTLFLCPLTAFAVLLGGYDGVGLLSLKEITDIFSRYLGASAPFLLLFSILAFAISTVLCWYYYGRVSFEHLFGKRLLFVYATAFFTLFTAGLFGKISQTLFIIDTTLFLLSLITLTAVIKESSKLDGCP